MQFDDALKLLTQIRDEFDSAETRLSKAYHLMGDAANECANARRVYAEIVARLSNFETVLRAAIPPEPIIVTGEERSALASTSDAASDDNVVSNDENSRRAADVDATDSLGRML